MADERPAMWVGHVSVEVADPLQSHDFYADTGMRHVYSGDDMAILELRGGTHLLLFKGEGTPGPAPFDLMVDDVDATHSALAGRGMTVSGITRGEIHDSFTLTDPDGHDITVHNTHVEGVV